MKKEDFDLKAFSKRFSEILNNSDENTHSLAKKLGLNPATISRYANGLMAPKLPTLYAIADLFNVNPIWLFGFDAPKYSEEYNNHTEKQIVFSYEGGNYGTSEQTLDTAKLKPLKRLHVEASNLSVEQINRLADLAKDMKK